MNHVLSLDGGGPGCRDRNGSSSTERCATCVQPVGSWRAGSRQASGDGDGLGDAGVRRRHEYPEEAARLDELDETLSRPQGKKDEIHVRGTFH